MNKNIADLFSLAGRVALVTDGTSGIGEMIARGLLMAGAEVFIVGRNEKTCAEKAVQLSEYGSCKGIAADISDADGIAILSTAIRQQAPSLSILVNNAGITAHASFADFPGEFWDSVLALNVKAPFMLIQALHPLLRKNASAVKPSHIINTGSIAGLIPRTLDSYSYGTSKAALHHLTRTLARQLASENIRVNAIAPGLFPSEMSAWIMDDPKTREMMLGTIPVGRFGSADDMATLIVSIAATSYMTGAIIPLDGGVIL